jgi:hypothetical protein
MITGYNGGSYFTQIWTNNGDSTFTQLAGTGMPGIQYGKALWGDYDNDGDLDILLAGQSSSGYVTQIWTNNGNSTFTQLANTTMPGVWKSSTAWGDYDNDGDLDFILTGLTGATTGSITQIWMNNGDSTFTQLAGTTMQGVNYGNVAWGDYDNDNDLDFILAGNNGSGRITQIWTNNGDSTFTQLANTSFPTVEKSSIAWGDYDNDGDLDLMITGTANGFIGATRAEIWTNNGDSTFTKLANTTFTTHCLLQQHSMGRL